jgi:thioesterase domain-containing protein
MAPRRAWAASESLLDGEPPTDWATRTSATADASVLAGNHYSVLRPPTVDVLAADLLAWLHTVA